MPRSARLGAVLVSLVMALTVAGCGSDDSGESGDSGDSAGSGSGGTTQVQKDSSGTPTIDVAFKGDTVEPQGKAAEIKAGEPLKLHITADQPGEIHVHSSPEQKIEYGAGTTDKTLTIEQPGVVDVESHHLDQVIVQLEVR